MVDKVCSFVKMNTKVKIIMVLRGDIESLRHSMPGMAQGHSFGCSQDRFDGMLYITRGVLLSVRVLCAASRLPMKSPPELVCGARMQE